MGNEVLKFERAVCSLNPKTGPRCNSCAKCELGDTGRTCFSTSANLFGLAQHLLFWMQCVPEKPPKLAIAPVEGNNSNKQ